MPADFEDIVEFVKAHRESRERFDVIKGETLPSGDPVQLVDTLATYEEVGVTWRVHSVGEWIGGLQAVRTQVRRGPPVL